MGLASGGYLSVEPVAKALADPTADQTEEVIAIPAAA